MPLDFQRARPLLQSGNLTKLFVEELGWEPARQKLTLRAGETDYAFTAVAEKRGFTAWLCASADGKLPDHSMRLKLDRKLSETSFEHLIVFATHDYAQQSWMWVRREQGKPLAARTHEFNRAQPGDSLLQKLQILYVSLEEEEAGLSVTEIASRARAAFDIERVTKAFYRDFDTHRKAFLKFIDGIGEVADCEWYASVMLNRLMFVYFIQRKGFLDGDHNYLRNRLDRCKKEQGKDKFYTFYRYFLLRLFHEGFGKRRKDRAPDLEKLLGNIPYLNGGLFDVHELEKPERYGQVIQIPDKAFERVFDYFDQYQWHLDERPLRADNEINPDVLGYIFEKYINQKQMGAYYTKEDITEYISKSTVLPFLFDAARAKCKVAFDPQPSTNNSQPTVWDLLRENPDRYIYPAVRHGADKTLPPEIAVGLDTTKPDLIERRKAWNKPAPSEYALPTETWREVIARRQRYWEVWSRLSGRQANSAWVANPPSAANVSPSPGGEGRGEGGRSTSITDINDFITLNLDLRQFAQDVIQNCEGPDLLMAFWQAITTITVLDPTGGSGAFIFAALNILEPLYEACLDRMEAFLAEWGENGRKAHPNYHKKFTEVLARVDAHPNRRYFVLKSIILNNLYAVDIMEEAVEICKLRLFLKLAAQVEPDTARDNLGIEPLPDIDFNIRAGNTLVGYATYDEVKRAVTGTLDFDNAMEKIAVKAADLQQTFDKFRQLQTEGDGSIPVSDKQELQKRLKALEDELNRHLAGEYGVKVSDKVAYAKWVKSHQPFHWFIHFYGILTGGGFDVIIGNPPYVEYSTVCNQYRVDGYQTIDCGNLYAFVIERSFNLLRQDARFGMIIPISAFSNRSMGDLQLFLRRFRPQHISHFHQRPAQLFEGVLQRLSIVLACKRGDDSKNILTTSVNRWFSEARQYLFQNLSFVPSPEIDGKCIVKVGAREESSIYLKWKAHEGISKYLSSGASRDKNFISYRTAGGGYWLTFLCKKFATESLSNKSAFFDSQYDSRVMMAVLSSSLFWWYYFSRYDLFNLKDYMIFSFRFNYPTNEAIEKDLIRLGEALQTSLLNSAVKYVIHSKTRGDQETFKYLNSKSKPLIDEIDTVLAGYYGFTAEELDFILNYDIKYRLGRDTENEEES